MVNVKMNLETLEIQIDGHAGGGPHGEDLVCCGVSTLAETLLIYMEKLMRDGLLADLKEEVKSGHVYLHPQPYGWSMEKVVTAIDVIRNGFKALAEQFSKYVTYEEE